MIVEFVCIGNYCRSPVAEKILNKLMPDLDCISSGISPMPNNGMHHLSKLFLEKKGVKKLLHVPKKFNFNQSVGEKEIICMDDVVFNKIWNKSPQLRTNLKIFTKYHQGKKIFDPLNFDEEKYELEMEKIYLVMKDWCGRLK